MVSTQKSILRILGIHPPSVLIGVSQSLAAYIQALGFGKLQGPVSRDIE
jgi:hypothetical protein